MVELAEAGLRALGVTGDLRVRHFGETARVELGREQLAQWSAEPQRAAVERAVRAAGFAQVEIDPRGFRSGASTCWPVCRECRDDVHCSGAALMFFGLIGRIGCAIILLIAGAVGYATKDIWIPKVKPHLPPIVQEFL